MKKYIFASALAMMSLIAFSSCNEEEGTMPGGDSKPSVRVYTSTPNDNVHDADNDVLVRLACNNKASEVYVYAEKTADVESFIKTNGAEAYMQQVVSKGIKLSLTEQEFDGAKVVDSYVTGLFGANTITAVAVDGNNMSMSSTDFFGITWITVSEGKVNARWIDGTTAATWSEDLVKLQYREDDPTTYRVKDAYGKGEHIAITVYPEVTLEDESGKYYNCAMTCPLPYEYSSYGQVTVQDYYTYNGENFDATYFYFEDGAFEIYSAYTVSAGRVATGWVRFYPTSWL